MEIVGPRSGNLKGIVKSVLFKGVHYETIVETKSGTEITVNMTVSEDKPVFNVEANEKMSANDFYIDLEDCENLSDSFIIDLADAQAWNPETEERISIHKVEYDILPEYGSYSVTFYTAMGTCVSVNCTVEDSNRVINEEYEEEIYASNFFKKIDEIQESIALETDLKTWANAVAFSLEDESPVTITDVVYDFDPVNITPGKYKVTFRTEGYEYKVDTTKETQVGEAVGLKFTPDAIHIMKKQNF